MDPWKKCQCSKSPTETNKTLLTEFEDNFQPEIDDKLPDHKKYLAALESKLLKLQSRPDLLQQVIARKEFYMQQLLSESTRPDSDQISLEEPIGDSPLLRTILPHRQALNQGEVLELVKHDQLSKEGTEDVRMQLDINVQMRQIPRPRSNHRLHRDILPLNDVEGNRDNAEDNLSDSSWTTFEEQEVIEDE